VHFSAASNSFTPLPWHAYAVLDGFQTKLTISRPHPGCIFLEQVVHKAGQGREIGTAGAVVEEETQQGTELTNIARGLELLNGGHLSLMRSEIISADAVAQVLQSLSTEYASSR
jgi:hypothetical protein